MDGIAAIVVFALGELMVGLGRCISTVSTGVSLCDAKGAGSRAVSIAILSTVLRPL